VHEQFLRYLGGSRAATSASYRMKDFRVAELIGRACGDAHDRSRRARARAARRHPARLVAVSAATVGRPRRDVGRARRDRGSELRGGAAARAGLRLYLGWLPVADGVGSLRHSCCRADARAAAHRLRRALTRAACSRCCSRRSSARRAPRGSTRAWCCAGTRSGRRCCRCELPRAGCGRRAHRLAGRRAGVRLPGVGRYFVQAP